MIAALALSLALQSAWMRKTSSYALAHVKPRARVRWYSRRFWFGAIEGVS